MFQDLSLIRSDLSPVTTFTCLVQCYSWPAVFPLNTPTSSSVAVPPDQPHAALLGLCDSSGAALCCSCVAGWERVTWVVIWRVGCPSTGSLVANTALSKPSNVKAECVGVDLTAFPQPIHSVQPREIAANWIGWCVYLEKVQWQTAHHRQQHRHTVHM